MIPSARRSFPWSRGPNGARAIGALLLALIAVARTAEGQEPEATEPTVPQDVRPPVTATFQPRRLDLGLSLFDGYDLTTVNDARGLSADPLLQQNAGFTGVNASLSFSQSSQDHTFGAAAGSGFRYYSVSPTVLPVNYFGGLNFSSKLGRRLQVRGAEYASMSPFYSFGSTLPLGDVPQIIPPQLDQGVVQLDTISSDSSVGLSWQISRKGSFIAGYTLNYVNTSDAAAYRVHTQGANGAYQYQKTRYLNLRFGYGYNLSAAPAPGFPSFASHNIDVGVGYRRPLSFSRRTVVGFNVGTTVFDAGPTRNFYVTGDASLSYQLSRRWAATMSYNRGVGKVAGQALPYVTDAIGGALSGLITPHLSLSGSGGYSRGDSAGLGDNAYHSIYASGRIGYSLTRFLPIYAEYVYYFYQFNTAAGLAPGIPLNVDRQGLRSGLSYALPLIGRRPTRR